MRLKDFIIERETQGDINIRAAVDRNAKYDLETAWDINKAEKIKNLTMEYADVYDDCKVFVGLRNFNNDTTKYKNLQNLKGPKLFLDKYTLPFQGLKKTPTHIFIDSIIDDIKNCDVGLQKQAGSDWIVTDRISGIYLNTENMSGKNRSSITVFLAYNKSEKNSCEYGCSPYTNDPEIIPYQEQIEDYINIVNPINNKIEDIIIKSKKIAYKSKYNSLNNPVNIKIQLKNDKNETEKIMVKVSKLMATAVLPDENNSKFIYLLNDIEGIDATDKNIVTNIKNYFKKLFNNVVKEAKLTNIKNNNGTRRPPARKKNKQRSKV